jgi:hypothetical protein
MSDKAVPSRFREANQHPPPGTPPNDTLGKIGSVLSKFIPSGEQLDVQASEKFMESIKGIIPEKGPYQEAYNKAAELFRQRKKLSDTGNAEGAKQTSKEAQGEMQKLLSLVSERQAAAFSEKRELENAGGAYIRAAFLYEKILEPVSAAAK